MTTDWVNQATSDEEQTKSKNVASSKQTTTKGGAVDWVGDINDLDATVSTTSASKVVDQPDMRERIKAGAMDMGRSAFYGLTGRDKGRTSFFSEFEGKYLDGWKQAKIAAALMAFPDEAQHIDIIKKIAPEIMITRDKHGNIVLTHETEKGTERGYLNAPGLSVRDITNFAGQAAAYLPSAKLGSIASNFLLRAGLTGGAAATTSVAVDKAAQAAGSTQDVDALRAILAGAVGAGGEIAIPALQNLGRSLVRFFSGKPSLFVDGRLTPAGKSAIRQAGFNPETIEESLSRAFAENAARNVDPGSLPNVSMADEFGIGLTRGQASQNFKQIAKEQEYLSNMGGDKAGVIMRTHRDANLRKGRDAIDSMQADIGEVENTYQRQGDAAGFVRDRLKEKSSLEFSAVDDAYTAAGELPAHISRDGIKQLPKFIRRQISDAQIVIDPKLTPSAYAALKDFDKLLEGPGRVSAVKLKRVEVLRRRLGHYYNTAANAGDGNAVKGLKRGLDQWIDEAFDKALFQGDDEALAAIKKARSLRRQYSLKYEPQKRKVGGRRIPDPARQVMDKLINHDPTDLQAAHFIFGSPKVLGKPQGTKALMHLKEVLGEGSDEWNALREIGFIRLVEKAKIGDDSFSPAKLKSALDEALNGDTAEMMEVLYNPKELAKFKRLLHVVRLMVPPKTATNPSGTAGALSRSFQDAIGKLAAVAGFAGDWMTAASVHGARQAGNASRTYSAKASVQLPIMPKRANASSISAALAAAIQGSSQSAKDLDAYSQY